MGLTLGQSPALPPIAANAGEETIRIDTAFGTIIGTLLLPEGEPAPVVLLFHGFTGTRNEMAVVNTQDGVFSRTARHLAAAGFASLRIDFRGSGDSDGNFEDTTFESQIADGLAAMHMIAADLRVKGDRLAVLGWSMGGLVATAVAGRSNKPKAVVLWAAVATPLPTFSSILGPDVIAAGLAAGDLPVTISLPWGGEIGLKQAFFEQLKTLDPVAELAAYTGPLLVAHGSLDTVVRPVSADLFLAAHKGSHEKWTAKMDHEFNAATGTEMLDEMVGQTIAFLDAQMT